jgi:ankyrin repeat protein
MGLPASLLAGFIILSFSAFPLYANDPFVKCESNFSGFKKSQQEEYFSAEYESEFNDLKKRRKEEYVPLGILVISDYGGKPALTADALIKIIDSGDTEKLKIKVNPKTINSVNKNGDTPLIYAAQKAAVPAIIDILVNAGADTEKRNKNGKTPLMLAAERPDFSAIAVALIKNKADVNSVYKKSGDSVLTLALSGSAVSDTVIQALADTGADVNFKNAQQNTPLLLAVKNTNNVSTAAILIKAGADTAQKDKYGFSPLQLALARPSYPGFAVSLAANGADINAVYENFMTPLMTALNNPSTKPEVIKTFINKGADLNARNIYGQTALMFAAINFDEETVKLFKKAKADFSIKDNEGRCARDYAKENPKISERFLKKMK